jgi:hypothetical protein
MTISGASRARCGRGACVADRARSTRGRGAGSQSPADAGGTGAGEPLSLRGGPLPVPDRPRRHAPYPGRLPGLAARERRHRPQPVRQARSSMLQRCRPSDGCISTSAIPATGYSRRLRARSRSASTLKQVRAERVTEDLIGHIMGESERRMLQALPREQRVAAFFNCWTSKEALLKGLGLGLSERLRAIEVSIDPRQPARLIDAPPEHCPGDWQLRRLEIAGPMRPRWPSGRHPHRS